MPEPRTELDKPAPDISAYKAPLEKIRPETRNLTLELEKRQEKILGQLPPIVDLVQRLYGHIQSQYLEGNLVAGFSTEQDERAVIVGELAEILATAEYSLFQLELKDRKLAGPVEKSDRKASEKLLGVLHNPEALNLSTQRNPDLAWFDIEKRKVRAIGEVKLGLLDGRCYRQLRPAGFINNVRRTVGVLNSEPKLGKEIFGTDPQTGETLKGGVADDVIEIVFVPRDTDIENNLENLLLLKDDKKDTKDKGLRREEADILLSLIKNGQIRLANFSFSRREVAELTTKIMERIKVQYPEIISDDKAGTPQQRPRPLQ